MKQKRKPSESRCNMALLESCCGCGLAVSSAVLGLYLLIAYIIAFGIELWWILDSSVASPIAAYLLCLGYFILVIFASVLLHGLSVKRTTFLLVWLFMMGILLGPEAGLVLYLSIHYWRITSLNGLIEITCWACRLLVNAVGLLCVQSLHSIWREEKSVIRRLEGLKMQSPACKINEDNRGTGPNLPIKSSKIYECKEKEAKVAGYNNEIPTWNHNRYNEDGEIYQNEKYDGTFTNPYFDESCNEFNASSFDPSVLDARLNGMPYLTVRKKPKDLEFTFPKPYSEVINESVILPKTRSLLDLSEANSKDVEMIEYQKDKSNTTGTNNFPRSDLPEKQEKTLDSLSKKIIKNKNLKILQKFPSFNSKKSNNTINIYRINPPKYKDATIFDRQLNKIYSTRGMYAFDEKSKKIIFYPPEFFNQASPELFRKRINSNVSNLSRSSADTDSEDLRHISDVAL